jgi:hypothetical protein
MSSIPQHFSIIVDKHLRLDLVAIHAAWTQDGETQHLQSVMTGQSFLEVGPQSIAVIVHKILQEHEKGEPHAHQQTSNHT